jgi:hypothetical protein
VLYGVVTPQSEHDHSLGARPHQVFTGEIRLTIGHLHAFSTSPKAIQRRAGAGQGSMYHHFSGKADLALAAVRRSADELRTAGERQLSHRGTAFERIEAYLRRERDVLRGCPIGRLDWG